MATPLISTITRITPNPEDLLGNTQILCTIAGCQSIFKNSSNLQMHLEKHHKLPTGINKDTSTKMFFCPELGCTYHEKSSTGKNFKCLKYLRQHYQKVHAEKCFSCSKCPKSFATQSMLVYHEKNCGKDYICTHCDWSYDSSEALLTHAKRKGHQVKRIAEEKPEKIAIPQLKEKITATVTKSTDRETQTEDNTVCIPLPPKKRMKVAISPEVNHFHETSLCDIETQTELNFDSGICYSMLSELGFSDTETQTNWSTMAEAEERGSNGKDLFSTTDDYREYHELMVSAETQTSFTQCLLDSCSTQYTQTCHTLMDGLFLEPDNDFIESFQSTHTQT